MTTTTPVSDPRNTRSFDTADLSQVPISRLAGVELRKALDTRAGRWFTIAILVVVLGALIVIACIPSDQNRANLESMVGIAGGVLGYFLPILIVMLVTSEASQRNGLITFTLEPRRPRVVLAKFIAGVALAGGVLVVAFAFAFVATALGAALGGQADWSVNWHLIVNAFVLISLVRVFVGFAIGMLVMNTAGGIVTYFGYALILPIAVAVLDGLSAGFERAAPWFDFNTALGALFDGDYTPSGEQWLQILVTGIIWLVIPLSLGIWRLLHIEFK